MSSLTFSTALRNAMLDAITTIAGNAALIRVYGGGSGRPASGAAITDQTLLATLTLGSPFAGSAASGELTLNALTSTTLAALEDAQWFRIVKSDGTTFVMDGSVGSPGSGADLIFNSASWSLGVIGDPVSITSFKFIHGDS